jgi:pyruvate dehydrogenase E2 component (dihydrolipoamide acetyltransferase)
MPKLSDTMTTGTIVNWLKKEGDTIAVGDVIAEVETDKATMDVEAFDEGTLLKIVAPAGEAVPCKSAIAVIGKKDEKFDEALLKKGPAVAPAQEAPKETKTEAPSASVAVAPTVTPSTAPSGGKVKASPLAKKVAAEKGVNLANLSGTGPGGRIVKKDVLASPSGGGGGGWGLNAAGPIAPEGKKPLSSMRRVIAQRLLESKTTIPHFYLTIEVDAEPLVLLRTALNKSLEKSGVKLSLNDFVLKATVESIRRAPAVNASFSPDGVIQYGGVHLAFAVAIADGLITPVIKDAQNKNLRQISEEAKVLAGKAKDGKLKPEEFQGGTFTVSNLGAWGIDSFYAIVNPPQAGILAVGNVVKKPVVKNDQIVVGQRMNVALSGDHRVIDGAVGAEFLKALREMLENPALLLL